MILIRLMQEADLEQVSELEKENFSSPWKKEDFAEALQNEQKFYIVAEDNNSIVGICGAFVLFDEAQISNVSVKQRYRKRHIAEDMMNMLIAIAKEKGAKEFTLEVRSSNVAAIALYRKLNFKIEGIRKNFYEHPIEDALIMWKR